MARMKGNRGTRGFQLPPVEVPVTFAGLEPPVGSEPPRKIRWWPALIAGLVLAVIVAGGVLLALRNDRDVSKAEPTEPATPVSATQQTATPSPPSLTATSNASAPATATTGQATPSSTASATPTATRTSSPPPSATATPGGPPLARTRYVVQSGDGCEVIRMKFRFANADFADFQVAMGALSGRSAATRCVVNAGDVLCVPTQNDLARLNALVKDDTCLAGS